MSANVALLAMLKRLYARTLGMRAFRETMAVIDGHRSSIKLPSAYARLWHPTFSAALSATQRFNSVPTDKLASTLGNKLATELKDDRLRDVVFLKKFLLRVCCVAHRLNILTDDRLVALVQRSGCYKSSVLPNSLRNVSDTTLHTLLSSGPLAQLSVRTPISVFKRIEKLMMDLEPKDAPRIQPVVDVFQKLLFDEYDKLHASFGGASGKIPLLYEKVIADATTLNPLLSRISAVVKRGYAADLNRKIRNAQNSATRERLLRMRSNFKENGIDPRKMFAKNSNFSSFADIFRQVANMPLSYADRNVVMKMRHFLTHIQTLMEIRRRILVGNSTGLTLQACLRIIDAYRKSTNAKYVLFKAPEYPGVIDIVDVDVGTSDMRLRNRTGVNALRQFLVSPGMRRSMI